MRHQKVETPIFPDLFILVIQLLQEPKVGGFKDIFFL